MNELCRAGTQKQPARCHILSEKYSLSIIKTLRNYLDTFPCKIALHKHLADSC